MRKSLLLVVILVLGSCSDPPPLQSEDTKNIGFKGNTDLPKSVEDIPVEQELIYTTVCDQLDSCPRCECDACPPCMCADTQTSCPDVVCEQQNITCECPDINETSIACPDVQVVEKPFDSSGGCRWDEDCTQPEDICMMRHCVGGLCELAFKPCFDGDSNTVDVCFPKEGCKHISGAGSILKGACLQGNSGSFDTAICGLFAGWDKKPNSYENNALLFPPVPLVDIVEDITGKEVFLHGWDAQCCNEDSAVCQYYKATSHCEHMKVAGTGMLYGGALPLFRIMHGWQCNTGTGGKPYLVNNQIPWVARGEHCFAKNKEFCEELMKRYPQVWSACLPFSMKELQEALAKHEKMVQEYKQWNYSGSALNHIFGNYYGWKQPLTALYYWVEQ